MVARCSHSGTALASRDPKSRFCAAAGNKEAKSTKERAGPIRKRALEVKLKRENSHFRRQDLGARCTHELNGFNLVKTVLPGRGPVNRKEEAACGESAGMAGNAGT